ncbi:MAG: efflux transporter outer membrane subunit [Gemmatimonadota bacterium]|nr:efflux transporter outer membrane subunit [Gemmatimonadota bacterium]
MAHIRKIIPILFFPLLITSGCAVHRPQPIELPVAPPGSFLSGQGAGAALDSAGRWWKNFDDPVLDSLMQVAFSRNLDLVQASARLEQLEAVTRSSASASYPRLDARGQAGRDKQPSVTGTQTASQYSLSLAASFELDLWRKLGSRTRAARLEALASRQDISTLYLGLSAQLADLYYLMVEKRAQLELTDSTIVLFSDILSLVERRYQEGIVPSIDVYQAHQNLSAAQAQRPVFEAALAVAGHGLSILLGRYPAAGVAGDLAVLPETPAAFPAGLPSDLIARRPDIQAGLLRLEASDARIAAAVADRFPSFNLLGGYGSSKSVLPLTTISSTFWNWLASLSMPLIDGRRRSAEVDRTRAVFKESLSRYQQTVLAAFKDVEDALVNNRATEERIKRTEERARSTSAMLRLALDQYRQGLTGYLPVLTAQSLDFDTRIQLLSARRQLISDRISLARALGGDWMEKESARRLAANNKQRTIR